jgi:hypothetical protein
MTFQEGAVYRAPDGKRYRAQLEFPRLDIIPAWTLVPVDFENSEFGSWRDTLTRLLFLEKEKIVFFHFEVYGPSIRETGWGEADFVRE